MISIRKITDIEDLQDANSTTTNGRPSLMNLAQGYFVRHSPIRTQLFILKADGAYKSVCDHLVRHHVGIEKYVGTSRPDRIGEQHVEDYRKMPKQIMLIFNADAFLNICEQRLCTCAEEPTREFVREMVSAMCYVDRALANRAYPMCVREGFCHQWKCCGYVNSRGYAFERAGYIDRSVLK